MCKCKVTNITILCLSAMFILCLQEFVPREVDLEAEFYGLDQV